jgi:hypothetical protein
MNPTDFMEFVKIVSDFGLKTKDLSDSETKELIKFRFQFGADHQSFFNFLINAIDIEEDSSIAERWTKFKELYASLYRCIALGHKEIFNAFELDLARTASRFNLDGILPDYPGLNQNDYNDMLTMTKEQFLDIMEQRKIARKQEEYDKADKDENGNVIYY